jgi:tetratricopeptide (TPR) repeat protein
LQFSQIPDISVPALLLPCAAMNQFRTSFRIRGSGILRFRYWFAVRWLALVWFASWVVPGRGADTNRLDALFQEALFAEEGRQDLSTAIRGYESVVRAVEEQRRFAATAVFRLGECYRKLGRTNDAVARYRQVLANYPGERMLADLARQNLLALGAPAGPVAGTNQTGAVVGPVDPDAPLEEERREMEQFERELRDSPDSAQRRMEERLRAAALNGKFWMAKALLKAGADPNRSDGDNKPPLHLAAAAGHKRVAQLLLQSGADPNLLKSGQRPLHMAMSGRNISMIEFLLDKGANPELCDKEGSTLLHQASSIRDNTRVRQLLL